jgi:hypothetical protein
MSERIPISATNPDIMLARESNLSWWRSELLDILVRTPRMISETKRAVMARKIRM